MKKVALMEIATAPIMLSEQIEKALNPAVVDRIAEDATDDALGVMAQQVRGLARASWTTYCIVCAHLVRRVTERGNGKRSRKGMTEVAKLIDAHISDVSRAVQVYERIIKPRVDRDGMEAQFPVNGRTYYELASDAERHSGTPALKYLELAEDRLAAGRFSVREFRQELIDQGAIPAAVRFHDATTRSDSTRIVEILSALLAVHDDGVEYLMRSDIDRASRLISEAHEALSRWSVVLDRYLMARPSTPEPDESEIDSEDFATE